MTRLAAAVALAFAACVDTIEHQDSSCIEIERDSEVVDLHDDEIVLKYDGSIPVDVGGSFYTCESRGALHVYRFARLSVAVPRTIAVQRMDGTCRLVHVDSVKPFNGEICE